MAQFCTKCGSPLPEGMRFCTGCGATVGEPAAPTAPPVVAPMAPAPRAVTPMVAPPVSSGVAPAAAKGSPVLKIVLIVLAVFVFFGLLSAGACVYMVYRAKQRVKQFERQVQSTFPRPSGTREVHVYPQSPSGGPAQATGPAIDLGVAVYPGATPSSAGTTMNMGSGAVKVQEYTTSDSVEQVTAFYKEKLGSGAMVTQRAQEAVVQLYGSNGIVSVTIAQDSNLGKTKFTISSIGK